jgi:hypothetical protein
MDFHIPTLKANANVRVFCKLQVWLELYEYPIDNERKLLEEVVDSWFTLGHLGGFNCLNLQVCPKWGLWLQLVSTHEYITHRKLSAAAVWGMENGSA